MIRASKICKTYRRGKAEVAALADVSFEIDSGESVALLGKSGSGKTTLLNLLGGLDRLSSGELLADGHSLGQCSKKDLDAYRQHSIGIVFQQFRLIRHRTAFQNIELPLIVAGQDRATRYQKVNACLDQVGLANRGHHFPTELSGGEQQRIAVARAIVNRPRILLADEPTGNLDSKNAVQIMQLLTGIQRDLDATMILVTHDEELAHSYTSRIIRLADGQVAESLENGPGAITVPDGITVPRASTQGGDS